MRALFSILFHLPRYLRLCWRLLRDPEVPKRLKWIVVGALVYAILPLDLIPDFTGIGLIEDFIFLVLSMRNLVKFSPPHLVTRHARRIAEGRRRRREKPPDPKP